MTDETESNSLTLLQKLKNKEGKKYKVLFTDIDDTYICQDSFDGHSSSISAATQKLTRFLNRHSISIVAVTARSINGAFQSCKSKELPPFDAIASSLGTEVWLRSRNGKYVLDQNYINKVKTDTNFDRAHMHDICYAFIEAQNKMYSHLGLNFQPHDKTKNISKFSITEEVRPYKISMNFNATPNEAQMLKSRFKYLLSKNNLSQIKAVTSMDKKIDSQRYRYNFDIVAATKDMAVSYIQQYYHCKGIVAGDSGNDKHMILNAGDAAIVVGKCKKDLLDEVQKHSIKRHKYLSAIQTNERQRIVYLEPQNSTLVGPQSLLNALQLFKDMEILLYNFNPFKFKWERLGISKI